MCLLDVTILDGISRESPKFYLQFSFFLRSEGVKGLPLMKLPLDGPEAPFRMTNDK